MIGHRGKRLCALLLALGLVPLGTAAVRTAPMEETVPVEITAPSAMLVEAETGTVIFEKNADEQRPVASVTKLMTLLLTFEALEEGTVSLEDQVTVSRAAAGQIGSHCWTRGRSILSRSCSNPPLSPAPMILPMRWPNIWRALRRISSPG